MGVEFVSPPNLGAWEAVGSWLSAVLMSAKQARQDSWGCSRMQVARLQLDF